MKLSGPQELKMSTNEPERNALGLFEKAQGAFLGAAIGDALGWPNENRSNRIGRRDSISAAKSFQRWVRRPGGRFLPHEDVILPGEYSDDTQLLLCTARSLLYGALWWKQFAICEFPFWKLYERGAGGATKRAADAWLTGKEPWSTELTREDRTRYFEAGGNGVAMRILPHILVPGSNDFHGVARDIVANGLVSHGHPRALVGALAYGYALWWACKQQTTLEYGALIEVTLERQKSWDALPDIHSICPTWFEAAQKISANRYEEIWRSSVDELISLFRISREAIKQGALAVDDETLERIGCFNPRVNGAGTVTAAAAIFLASRYAADPVHGILKAAFAPGADTDTVASMTGALLGVVRGREWLGDYLDDVQDSEYLRSLADQICQATQVPVQAHGTDIRGVRKSDCDTLISKLLKSQDGATISLPDSREGKVCSSQKHTSGSTLDVISWKLRTADGQTLYVKRITRKPRQRKSRTPGHDPVRSLVQNSHIERLLVKLPVASLERSRGFYRDVIGLKLQMESPSKVRFEGGIELVVKTYPADSGSSVEKPHDNESRWRTILLLETHALERVYHRIKEFGAEIQTPITEKSGRRFFRCLDPDQNLLEVLDARSNGNK
jgi:ADP-ribosylglycohydrolase/predicted enzyme related to lactoylglutathione lyase